MLSVQLKLAYDVELAEPTKYSITVSNFGHNNTFIVGHILFWARVCLFGEIRDYIEKVESAQKPNHLTGVVPICITESHVIIQESPKNMLLVTSVMILNFSQII